MAPRKMGGDVGTRRQAEPCPFFRILQQRTTAAARRSIAPLGCNNPVCSWMTIPHLSDRFAYDRQPQCGHIGQFDGAFGAVEQGVVHEVEITSAERNTSGSASSGNQPVSSTAPHKPASVIIRWNCSPSASCKLALTTRMPHPESVSTRCNTATNRATSN